MSRARALKLLGITTAMILVLSLTMILDRAAGVVLAATMPRKAASPNGLLFPPRTRMRHVTPEFDYTVQINSAGFRGPEYPRAKGDTFRIAIIGDSYVYGWGVPDANTWPAVLQRNLRAAGLPVAVANLGQPGAQPRGYADVAEAAVPALKPDLVIVGVLSGQDYAQEWWSTQTVRERIQTASAREMPTLVLRKFESAASRIGARFYPTTLALLTRPSSQPDRQSTDISLDATRAALREQAREVEALCDSAERARLARLDTSVVRQFRDGDLNAAVLYYSLKRPEYFQLTEQYSTPRGQTVVGAIASALSRIRRVTERYGGTAVTFSIPYMPYASRRDCEEVQRLGYTCDARMYTGGDADSATFDAARRAGVRAYATTAEVRKAAATTELYYPYDTHFNVTGYKLFADLTTPIVASLVDSLRAGHHGVHAP